MRVLMNLRGIRRRPGRLLYAINPNGTIKYQRDFAEPFGDSLVSPDNLVRI